LDRRVTAYSLEPSHPTQRLLERLSGRFEVEIHPVRSEQRTYYDTFDRRLLAEGAALAATGPAGSARPPANGSTAGSGPSARRRPPPRSAALTLLLTPRNGGPTRRQPLAAEPTFARELPPGPVRELLLPVADSRRLLPLVQVARRIVAVDVLDEEEKTVVHLEIEESLAATPGSRPAGAPFRRIVARSVRGYDARYVEVLHFLAEHLGLRRSEASELQCALDRVAPPGAPGPPQRPELDPDAPASKAAKQVLFGILEQGLAHLDGVKADVDPEFLHDFRVALRRMRALLGELKDVFPKPLVDHYREELAWIARVTGPLRDLDVCLWELPGRLGDLDAEHREALAPLAEELGARRAAAQAELLTALESARFRNLVRNWRLFLEDSRSPKTLPRRASEGIRSVVGRRIVRRFRRIVKGREELPGAPDERLHAVRIQCKRLRYLIDAFGALYDGETSRLAVRELKKIQDVLGEFHDCEVHAQIFEDAAKAVAERAPSPALLLATGALIDRLGRRKEKQRRSFGKRFARFTRGEVRRRWLEAFAGAEGA